MSAKFSVINTLKHRAMIVCSNHQLLKEEEDQLNKALRRCKYPAWALNRANIKQKNNKRTNQDPGNNRNSTGSNNNKPYIVVPYVKGMSESYKNICRKHGIEMCLKGGNTIKELLVHPKDKDIILQKSEVIIRYKCGRVDCKEEYIGEPGRTFADRFREHMRATSPIRDHHDTTGHDLSLENFSIVGREDQSIARATKEATLNQVQ